MGKPSPAGHRHLCVALSPRGQAHDEAELTTRPSYRRGHAQGEAAGPRGHPHGGQAGRTAATPPHAEEPLRRGDADLVEQQAVARAEVAGRSLDSQATTALLDLVDHGDLVPAGVDQGDPDHVRTLAVRAELAQLQDRLRAGPAGADPGAGLVAAAGPALDSLAGEHARLLRPSTRRPRR